LATGAIVPSGNSYSLCLHGVGNRSPPPPTPGCIAFNPIPGKDHGIGRIYPNLGQNPYNPVGIIAMKNALLQRID
jgi:hypothetical protein